MRGDGDDADLALLVAIVEVIGSDGHQPCVLPGSTRVGLQGDGVKAGDGGQLSCQILQQRPHQCLLGHEHVLLIAFIPSSPAYPEDKIHVAYSRHLSIFQDLLQFWTAPITGTATPLKRKLSTLQACNIPYRLMSPSHPSAS